MLCLGIESTAHSFSIGVVSDKGEVLSNVIDMYRPPEGWGIKPAEAAEHHREVKERVLEGALSEAGRSMEEIGLMAFSQGAGLPPCLHVGLGLAKELSGRTGKPLVGVCHQVAHIEIGRLTSGLGDPVVVYTSGANTQIISHVSGRYRVFGETQDIGLGNALDKFGRETGLGFPAGPEIEAQAQGGRYQELPYTVKGMDLSFSGIVTEAVRRVKAGQPMKDVSFSLQETLFAMLTEVTERALAHTKKDQVLLTGGVAANRRLQGMLDIMCRERGATSSVVPKGLSGDNGAMIAWTGILMRGAGMRTEDGILPRLRTDDVEVRWL